MAATKLSELAAVMNESNRNGLVLGFDTVSGDIRTYDVDQLVEGGGGGAGGDVTATNSTVTRSLEDWMADGIIVRDIATLKQLEGFESDQVVYVLGYYSDTRGIGGGYFYWNGGSTYPEDGGSVIAVDGVEAGRWNRVMDGSGTIYSEDFGLFNGREIEDGVEDIIDSMRRVAPDGGVLKFIPTDNPIRTRKIRVDEKNLTFDLNGNYVVGVDNEQVFELVGAVENISDVDFLELVPYNNLGFENDSSRMVTQVSFADAADYAPGDIVKIISNDELTDLFNPDRRQGEFATVAATTDTTVTLFSKLFDHENYTDDVRIAKVKDIRYHIKNATFLADDQADPTIEWGPSRIHMEMVTYPTIENVKGFNLDRRLISMYSCFAYVVRDCHTVNSANYPVGEGYVLNDVGGYDGFAENISSDHCRHVVTTNSRATNDRDDFNRGRGLHLTVVGGIGKNSYNHAFDTHPESAYTTFIGCKAYQCDGGFQSRSPYTVFESCYAYECSRPFMAGTARENYANSFRYTRFNNCHAINTDPANTYYDCTLKVTGESLTSINYGPVFVSGGNIEYINHDNTGTNVILDCNLENTEVHFDNVRINGDDTASARLFKIGIGSNSRLFLDGITVYNKAVNNNEFRIVQFTGTWPTEGDTPIVYCTNLTFTGPTPVDAIVASSDAYLAGNSIETISANFEARKFDGELVQPAYTD